MIRPHRSVRFGAAVLGVMGAVTLAGCSTTATDTAGTDTSTGTSDSGTSTTDAGTSGSSSATYTDGSYTATGSYRTPESVETIQVTVELTDGVIESVSVEGDPQARESQRYQSEFIGGIDAEVVGKNIDDISVSKVAGSSLTSGGFTQAIEEIKYEASS